MATYWEGKVERERERMAKHDRRKTEVEARKDWGVSVSRNSMCALSIRPPAFPPCESRQGTPPITPLLFWGGIRFMGSCRRCENTKRACAKKTDGAVQSRGKSFERSFTVHAVSEASPPSQLLSPFEQQ